MELGRQQEITKDKIKKVRNMVEATDCEDYFTGHK